MISYTCQELGSVIQTNLLHHLCSVVGEGHLLDDVVIRFKTKNVIHVDASPGQTATMAMGWSVVAYVRIHAPNIASSTDKDALEYRYRSTGDDRSIMTSRIE